MERSTFLCQSFKEQIRRRETRRIKRVRRRMERAEVATVMKNGSPVPQWGRPACFSRHRPSPRKAPPLHHSGWPKRWHRPRQPLDPPQTNSVHPCTYCIGAAKLCLLTFFFFNCRLSLDSRSHDQLFFTSFFLNALLSVDAFGCFIFLLPVFSFLKLAFGSCFANNRHAFVLFFVLNGFGGDDSAQRSIPGCYSRGQNVIFYFIFFTNCKWLPTLFDRSCSNQWNI